MSDYAKMAKRLLVRQRRLLCLLNTDAPWADTVRLLRGKLVTLSVKTESLSRTERGEAVRQHICERCYGVLTNGVCLKAEELDG